MYSQATVSISKGCFVFNKNLIDTPSKKPQKKKRNSHLKVKSGRGLIQSHTSLLSQQFKSQNWYQAFTNLWTYVDDANEKLKTIGYQQTMNYLKTFITTNYDDNAPHSFSMFIGDRKNLPTTALLTGINQPDHLEFFKAFAKSVKQELNSHVCIIQSQDCPHMKGAIESMVYGLMNDNNFNDNDDDDGDGDSDDEDTIKKLRRSQYSLAVLKSWYKKHYGNIRHQPILTIIIPDFENFHQDVIQQFILLLSHNCNLLPIALVLGVATDLATLHRTLSILDMSRMNLQVSQSPPSTHTLSQILDEIILTPKCSMYLSGRVFSLLTDIFLYFDLSINSFMQGFKYCVMEHFSQGNAYSLCKPYENNDKIIKTLNADDLMTIRRLPSFRRYVESLNDCRQVIAILTDDEHLSMELNERMLQIHIYFTQFYCILRVLLSLVQELPKNLMGKQLRDLYATCTTQDVVQLPEFQELWNLLSFMSKDEFLLQLKKVVKTIEIYSKKYCNNIDLVSEHCRKTFEQIIIKLNKMINKIECAGMINNETTNIQEEKPSSDMINLNKVENRQDLQKKLLEMAKKPKSQNEYTKLINETLDYIKNDIFSIYLIPFQRGPALLELFVFSDLNSIRSHIMGAPRATLHTGLNNPQNYLQCQCCQIDDAAQMVATMPDLSIAYKLHLESGHFINLFDWLQAFKSIVCGGGGDYINRDENRATANDSGDDDDNIDNDQIDPQLQARFTRSVAELQFLGFIKSTKRKTDHVMRLTW